MSESILAHPSNLPERCPVKCWFKSSFSSSGFNQPKVSRTSCFFSRFD